MKINYLIVFFLIIGASVNAQIPGTPVFMRSTPQVYTYSAAFSSVTSANITGQIFTNGQPLAETGIVWGTSPTLTIESATGTTTVNIYSGTPSATITGLSAGTIYYVALYAKTSNATTIGNSVTYEHGTVTTATGRKWLQWNLGATRYPPTAFNDLDNYGNLYQWGRGNDGSQYKAGGASSPHPYAVSTTSVKAYNDYSVILSPPNSRYVITTNSDWFTPSYDGLWQGVNGINNPCPSGYRVPTTTEFTTELTAGSITNAASAFSSTLKLTSQGNRFPSSGNMSNITVGYYWTSNVVSRTDAYTSARFLVLSAGSTTFTTDDKARGGVVRCIQDDVNLNSSVNTSGGTARVASYSCPSSGYSGSIYPVPNPALGANDTGKGATTTATQTITANVTQAGTYSLGAYSNGVTFAGSGTFAGTGSQTITLTATGTSKNTAGDYFIALQNVSPGCDFNAPVYSNTSGGSAVITWNIAQTGTGAPTTEQAAENDRDLIANVESSTYSPPFIHYRRVNVTTAGSYNIDVPSNRDGNLLRLVGSGTFSTTGFQIMTLYLIGAPSNWGSRANHYFYLPYPSHTPSTNRAEIIRFSQ
jgi:hypothetical protein